MATNTSPATGTIPSSQNAPKSCVACDALDKLLTENDVGLSLDERQVYNDFCAEHSPCFDWIDTRFEERFASMKKAQIIHSGADCDLWDMCLLRDRGGIPRINAFNCKGSRYQSYQILIHSKNSLEHNNGDAPIYVMDPEWIDLGIARSWMERCIAEHTSECQRSRESHVSPAWLIDTEDNCLVPGRNLPFVALSYRWGSSTSPKMDKKAFQDMMRPGSFAQDNGLLAPTIQDAIHTVRTIGERHLWVDAICIAPDNEKVLADQLQAMGSIYASAKLTIVALDGDANTGLKGLKSQSPPRSLPNIFSWKDGRQFMVRHLPALSVKDAEASRYFKRGWTYQEYVLSRRRLIFGNQQIHWQCSCATWHEDLPQRQAVSDDEKSYSFEFPNIKNEWPDFAEFSTLINEYNSRELTYPEDAFPAINGLLTYLEKSSFEKGFLFGLPRAFFEASLMWSCDFDMSTLSSPVRSGLRRRKTSYGRHSILPNTYLPSWSWIGWQGDGIKVLEREAQFLRSTYMVNSHKKHAKLLRGSIITIPITQWYSQGSIDGAGKRLIPCSPTVYKEHSDIPYDRALWTIKDGIEDQSIPVEAGGKHVYEHVNRPGVYFMWPLPNGNKEEDGTRNKVKQNPFISCRTRRTWFGALRKQEFNFRVWQDIHLCLFDRQRGLCGWLQLPSHEYALGFPSARVQPDLRNMSLPLGVQDTFLNQFPKRKKRLELVAICICKHPQHDRNGKVKLEEFYGVLWVKWLNGVAYRRGCGYVQKELWENQDLEDVDLVLG
ncbi:hypothetical protein FPRO03_01760 [Fusarium proliferatum]|nr:hypothetical protein FPRO03_01760 [Fusarium proliferatum]